MWLLYCCKYNAEVNGNAAFLKSTEFLTDPLTWPEGDLLTAVHWLPTVTKFKTDIVHHNVGPPIPYVYVKIPCYDKKKNFIIQDLVCKPKLSERAVDSVVLVSTGSSSHLIDIFSTCLSGVEPFTAHF